MALNLVILQVQNFFIPGLKILKNIGVGDLCRNYAGLEYVTLQRNKFLHWNFSRFLTANFKIATNPVKTNFANLVGPIRYAESAKWRAQRAHVLYLSYVPTRPTCSTCPRTIHALPAHVRKYIQYILQIGKLKNGNFIPIRF